MHPLTQKIASLQRRLVWRQRAAAACWISATAIAAALVLGAVDYFIRFSDPGLRIIATFALVAAITWAVYRWWYLPSRRPLAPLAVAQQVETHFPQFRDALTSAVGFLEQSEDDATAGSPQLRRLVVTQAQTAIEEVELDKVIDRGPLRRAARWLVAAVLVLVACLAWDTSVVGTALARLAAPLGSASWPREHHLAFRDVPKRMVAGQTFEVELVDTAGPLPDAVRIEYRFATDRGRQSISEAMTRAGDVMVARRENVGESFAFRATGDDDHTMKWHWVEVVEPPQLESLAIKVHPPEYTGLPATMAERHLEVLAGTGIEIRGTANAPLGAARILLDDQEPIAADILADSAGNERREFRVEPYKFVASISGPYRLELEDRQGVAGVVGKWNLRVVPDEPPSISWRWPSADLYVTARAALPIELAVADDLAIQRVDMLYERADQTTTQRGGESTPTTVELYGGPDQPVSDQLESVVGRGDNRVVEFIWDLVPLALPVGTQLTVHAEAADYRPGVGHTVSPRRITIITNAELEARLADRQAQIVRQLERALALQRTTHEEVEQLEIQQRDAGNLAASDRGALETAELNQQRVGRTLVNPAEGVPPLVDALLQEIEINRLSASDLRASMQRLLDELERLSSGPLNIAERELIAARKAAEFTTQIPRPALTVPRPVPVRDRERDDDTTSNEAEPLSTALTAARIAQTDVIATLERLLVELSGRVDFRRLVQQLAELHADQIAHGEAAREEIGLETLPLQMNELSRSQLASLNKAAATQNAIADRFGRVQSSMDSLSNELARESSDTAASLANAVALARELAIASAMRETARDLSANRVGQALARESKIAAHLQQVLDALRNQEEQSPKTLVAKLREAERQLARLRERLAALRESIAQAEQQPAARDAPRLAQLHEREQSLKRQIAQLSRQLDRLGAPDAGRSTRSAANRLAKESPGQTQPREQSQRPSASRDVQQAERDLEQAAAELAQRRQEAENNLALEFVRRFQAELGQMVERQRKVIVETAKVDGQRQPNRKLDSDAAPAIKKLAHEERTLAEMAHEHSEFLHDLVAVRISLEEAKRRLAVAAELLENNHTGLPAQTAEQHALTRLEGMLEAFAQTASEAAPTQPPPAGTGNAAGQPPQRRPTFELLEVKMLRMLQVDLNERTRAYQERLAGISGQPNERERAELAREARELQAQQARLAELVQEMLTRDNEQGE